MKRLLILFFLLSSFLVSGQVRGIFRSSTPAPVSDTTAHNLSVRHITNPAWHVARHDTTYSITVDSIPFGYSASGITWALKQHNYVGTPQLETFGAGQSISFLPQYRGQDTTNTYFVELWVVPDASAYKLSTSTTSQNIASVSSNWTVATGLHIPTGHVIRFQSRSDTSNWIQARVTGYTSGTGALTVNTSTATTRGSGTKADWDVVLPRLHKAFWGAVTVQPGRFSEADADLVWDESVAVNGGNFSGTNRPGLKIFMKGTRNGAFLLAVFGLYSNDPDNPIHIEGSHVHLTSTTAQFFNVGLNRNIIWDGCLSTTSQTYGFTLEKGSGGTGETIYNKFTESSSGYSSVGWTFSGFDVDNHSEAAGGACFRMLPVASSSFNATNFTMKYITIFNCRGRNSVNELVYLGFTRDYNSPQESPLQYLLVYNNDFQYGANENLQIGSAWDALIFGNNLSHGGQGGIATQDYAEEWSLGNKRMVWFANYSTTSHSGIQAFTGRTGSDCEYFSNVLIDASTQNSIFKLYHNDYYSTINWRFEHNNFVSSTGIIFNMYNDTGLGTVNATLKMFTDANDLTSNTTTQHQNNGGFDDSQSIFNNKAYSSSTSQLYTNFSGGDLRPRSLASPNFIFARNTSNQSTSYYAAFGIDGWAYWPENMAAGAYSGTKLHLRGLTGIGY